MQIGFFYCTPPQNFITISFRMRKYIIPLFLSLCPTMAMAATNAECKQSYIDNNQRCASTGCGYYNNECVACPAGTYQNQPPALEDLLLGSIRGTECNSCNTPWQFDVQSINWSWDKSKTGMVYPDDCTIYVHIPKGHELIEKQDFSQYTVQECADNHYKTESTTLSYTLTDTSNPYPDIPLPSSDPIPDDAKCKECGNNATHNADHTNCDCNYGYHIGTDINNTKNVGSENCTTITFDVKYSDGSNTLDDNKIPIRYKTIGLTQSLTLPTIDCNQPSINGIPQSLCMTKTGYNFDNQWTADKKLNVCAAGQCIGEKYAGELITVGATAYLTGDDMGDVTFTAVWKPKQFTVTYDTDNKCPTETQDCTYEYCYLKYDNTCNTTGQYISGWQCTSGCSDKDTTYKSGDNISNISGGNDMTLTAILEDCDAGYYCDGGTPNACPAGSTSDGGSKSITDCYLSHETQFCNDDACFTIPDLKIPYSSK